MAPLVGKPAAEGDGEWSHLEALQERLRTVAKAQREASTAISGDKAAGASVPVAATWDRVASPWRLADAMSPKPKSE